MKTVKLTLYLLAIVIVGCANNEKPVASVNNVPICREDIELRCAVYSECDRRTEIDTISVFAECIRDALEKAVLNDKYGLSPPVPAMAEKVKWIDKNTKDPQRWTCVKRIYKSKKEALDRNVISPILVNQKLHSMFSLDTLIHRSVRDSIAKIFEKVRRFPDSLASLAGYDTIKTRRYCDENKSNGVGVVDISSSSCSSFSCSAADNELSGKTDE